MAGIKPVSTNNDKEENSSIERNNILKAHEEAQSDIENDPELSIKPETGDDLDEGELARLEGEE